MNFKITNILLASFCLVLLQACTENQSSQNTTPEENTNVSDSNNSERTADYNEQKNAYFGDLHVHTSWSFDAFIYNVRTTPEDAYRYGQGEAIDHVSGNKIQLQRPLDFMAVTDHAEYMGIMKKMIDPESPLSQLDIAKQIKDPDRAVSLAAFSEIGTSLARNQPKEELANKDIMKSTWDELIKTADKFNTPGKFTTFPAYEWTSSPGVLDHNPTFARNLHRNVIYKGSKVSDIPFSSFDSQNPEELWKWMDAERAKGIDLMAIPHNANMSDGLMYDLQTLDGQPIDAAYAESRSRNEIVNEVTQIKGTSMVHPALAPNDEFANFEIYAYTFSASIPPPSKPEGSYVRNALQNGLALEQEIGTNPFKFGFIGSSDGHNSASPVEEDNYFGKLGNIDATPELRVGSSDEFVRSKFFSAAGLAGVWAEENTRDAIYESMERKEIFATTGPRIQVRFFAGWDFKKDAFENEDWVKNAYANGIPMGSDLPNHPSSATSHQPSFLIWAVKDSDGANLDRVQVIKSWIDENGNKKEKIFDAVWSGNRAIMEDGSLELVGNTVNVKEATYTNEIGAVELKTTWTDPEFDPKESAVYYLRVLEIPTPRWSTYDSKNLGTEPMMEVSPIIQERAWSSPIWYSNK